MHRRDAETRLAIIKKALKDLETDETVSENGRDIGRTFVQAMLTHEGTTDEACAKDVDLYIEIMVNLTVLVSTANGGSVLSALLLHETAGKKMKVVLARALAEGALKP